MVKGECRVSQLNRRLTPICLSTDVLGKSMVLVSAMTA